MKAGLIVNPIAGMGGRVALKGTDGVVEEAIRRGAEPMAIEFTKLFLKELSHYHVSIRFFTGPNGLGEDALKEFEFPYRVIKHRKIGEKEISYLEGLIKKFEENVKLEGFVIPGSTVASAKLDLCRTIARRAERRVSKVVLEYGIAKDALRYLNRLSDLLFVMARYVELKGGKIKYVR